MNILAIDPGASGGLCLYNDEGPHIVSKMPPTPTEVAKTIKGLAAMATRCVIEQIGMRPGEGQRSTATFYQGFGFLLGCLTTLEVPFELVRPQAWQAGLGLPSRTAPKGASKNDRAALKRQHKRDLAEAARQRWPTFEGITLLTCDAMLMGQWGWLRYKA